MKKIMLNTSTEASWSLVDYEHSLKQDLKMLTKYNKTSGCMLSYIHNLSTLNQELLECTDYNEFKQLRSKSLSIAKLMNHYCKVFGQITLNNYLDKTRTLISNLECNFTI
jgi:hypothetical protein